MTLTFTRAASLLLATSALSLAACTNINLPPSTDSNVPVVDASIHPTGAAPPAPGATTSAVGSSQVTGQPLAGALLNGLHLQAGTFSSQANADRAADNIRTKVPSMAGKVFVAPRGVNFRVLIGPFANDQERAAAAGTIRTGTGSEVVNAAP